MKKVNCDGALTSWRSLNAVVGHMTELQLEQALTAERSGRRRPSIMRRLHQRLGKVRAARERRELGRNP